MLEQIVLEVMRGYVDVNIRCSRCLKPAQMVHLHQKLQLNVLRAFYRLDQSQDGRVGARF